MIALFCEETILPTEQKTVIYLALRDALRDRRRLAKEVRFSPDCRRSALRMALDVRAALRLFSVGSVVSVRNLSCGGVA